MSASAPALLAKNHRLGSAGKGYTLRPRINRLARRIKALYVRLLARRRDVQALPSGAEWLLDNDYVVQGAIRIVRKSLPARFMRQLPRSSGSRETCVRELCDYVLQEGGSPVDIDWLVDALEQYQSVSTLTTGELWALPAMLRMAILEELVAETETLLDDKPESVGHRTAIASLIVSLRTLESTNWLAFVERVSAVDHVLNDDPAGFYLLMDRDTRNRYRRQVEVLARWARIDEVSVARQTNDLAALASGGRERHVGFYLIADGRRLLESQLRARIPLSRRLARTARRFARVLFPVSISALSLGIVLPMLITLSAAGSALWAIVVAGLCAFVVAGTVATAVVNWFVTHWVSPKVLPKLDFELNATRDCRAAVAVPVLLGEAAHLDPVLARLEMNYLGNAEPSLHFVLLTDLADADTETTPGDEATLQAARDGIEQLRARYPDGKFYWLHRPRRWNPVAGKWMAWERKRGKLWYFNRLVLSGDVAAFSATSGRLEELRGLPRVITLDADTQLPSGAAMRLLGTFAHPLNQPQFADDGGLLAGYTVIQPRLETTPDSANENVFTRAFAANTVLDLYSSVVSDVYHDVFGDAIFSGKAAYDVAGFDITLAGRIPDNAILSHDLFEGLHGRVGLASDVVLFEDMPRNALAYLRRQHRWVRGDWQLLPWLFASVPGADGRRVASRFGFMARWKIADNLRRSLNSPAVLALLLLGWLALPVQPWVWTLGWLATLAMPLWLGTLSGFLQSLRPHSSTRRALAGAGWTLQQEIRRAMFSMVLLPYEALVNLDAVVRTLWRMRFARGRLLEWTPAAFADRRLGGRLTLLLAVRQMHTTLWMVGAAAIGVLTLAPNPTWPAALPLLAVWLVAPLVISAFSARLPARRRGSLDNRSRRELRLIARKTWAFFEAFVGPDRHWLPPDNVHEQPRKFVAERTSPTNIGVMLTSTLAAFDFGYLTVQGLAARLAHSLDTVERLERHAGHLLNWYNTRTLEPLRPRYVSTVDSGNLAGALLVLAAGLDEVIKRPQSFERLRDGLLDSVAVLRELLVSHSRSAAARQIECCDLLADHVASIDGLAGWYQMLRAVMTVDFPSLVEAVTALVERDFDSLGAERVAEIRSSMGHVSHQLQGASGNIDQLLPWLGVLAAGITPAEAEAADVLTSLNDPPPLSAVPGWTMRLRRQIERRPQMLQDQQQRELLLAALSAGGEQTRRLLEELDSLAGRCRRFASATDFGFLYDEQRHLFHIGYNVSAAEYDANHYDLLASEARLASYLAIGFGQVPVKHWLQLGRPFTRIAGRRVLVSWSATAFEYLMPCLFMATPAQGLMGQSCRAAVRKQQQFARRHRTPWGISESSFNELDEQSHYQYRAFGVPGLGLKREKEFRLVISPYASLLALPYAPAAVVANLRRLKRLDATGRYGALEAVDFGNPGDAPMARVVGCYMSHHQGMIMMAIANALCNNIMVRRFHSNPDLGRVDYLLYERLPPGVPRKLGYRSGGRREVATSLPTGLQTWEPVPGERALAVLSNGELHAVIANDGSMSMSWHDLQVTRGMPLAEASAPAQRVYLRDCESGSTWVVGATTVSGRRRVVFAPHEVRLHHEWAKLRCRLSVTVAQDRDVLILRLLLHNTGSKPRRVQALHYAEPVLCPAADDERHPGFNKLFIEAADAGKQTLVFRRRLRGTHEQPVYLATAMVGGSPGSELCCTDRAAFLTGGGAYQNPAWLQHARPGPGAPQPSLDPVSALGAEIMLQPNQRVEVFWFCAVGSRRSKLMASLSHYRQRQHANWAFWHARFGSERELQEVRLEPARVQHVMRIASRLFSQAIADATDLQRCSALQGALWALGISGDRPIALVHLREADDIGLARDAIKGWQFLCSRGLYTDLVVIDHVSSGYAQPTRDKLHQLTEGANRQTYAQRGRVLLLGAADAPGRELRALRTAASLALDSQRGPLETQLERPPAPAPLPAFVPMPGGPLAADGPALTRPVGLQLDNGVGGFSQNGSEYVMFLEAGELPPQPWINVLANPHFGTLVSASGASFTWARNSGENRLTPWHNDPVLDPTGEALYLRDEESGKVWSPTPRPCPDAQPYEIRHGAGYTRFHHASHSLDQKLSVHVDAQLPVKHLTLELKNLIDRPRRITVTAYVEWVLGNDANRDAPYVVSEFVRDSSALLARNTFRRDCPDATAFLATDQPVHGMTADCREFVGNGGDLSAPAALYRIGLSGRLDAGISPCAVLQVHVDLPALSKHTVCFVLGEAPSREAALKLVRQTREDSAASFKAAADFWRHALGGLQVETPVPAFDLLVNRCLLYQAQACRLWARAALYQCGGGQGFRDQLQDVMALTAHQPVLARTQILDAAASQFVEGDVLHWWHTDPRRGVRTRCSDDLVWLPFVTAHYVSVTGDPSIMAEQVSFLNAPVLSDNEPERYGEFDATVLPASLYEHCWRAIDLALSRRGAHGLPLIGTGDWNDGFSRVGVAGKGESVWLAWFLIATCRQFIPMCEAEGDPHRADRYRQAIQRLTASVEENAWDGQWYRRAYYDDGGPLGSAENDECRIDMNAQSWAAISGAGAEQRVEQAMASAQAELVNIRERLVLLLAPPFDKTASDPGYIKGYPPGVRENGGQYTHAAIWAAWALADMGRSEDAWQLFDLLNPLARCTSREAVARYRVEPYVMAADVYGCEPFTGRGGWTWYTGAASWMHRLAVEKILGIRKLGDRLELRPALPAGWPGYKAIWRHGDSTWHIEVSRCDASGGNVASLEVDGEPREGTQVQLLDDGQSHRVLCRLSRPD